MSNKLISKVEAKKCPKCGKRKLLPGPFYDRLRVRCQNCGRVFQFVATKKVA